MLKNLSTHRVVWLVAGVLLGLTASAFLPHTPSWAVSTDRQDTYAVCTGPLDDDLEAVYFLDFLTGDLRAAVLSLQTGRFTGFFEYNIARDLAADPGKTPRYTMVTGVANLRQNTGQLRPSNSIVYITEGSSGKVAAYAIPWNRGRAGQTQPYKDQMFPLDMTLLRTAAVR
jgi:hypothetical protein